MTLEVFREALRLLWAHKLRSVLTLSGIVWGTAAVVFLVAWGEGVRDMLERGFFKAGRNMGEVWAGRVGEDFSPAADRRDLWYSNDDVTALRRRAHLPEQIGAEYWQFLPVGWRQRSLNVDVRGVDAETVEIRGVRVAAGRAINGGDVEQRRRVAVLGAALYLQLFGAEGRPGSSIRIDGRPFQVVGILDEVGTQLSRDRMEIDRQLWVPLSTLQAHWPASWTPEPVVTKILYRLRDRHLLEQTEQEVRAVLAERLGVGANDSEAVGIWSSLTMLNRLPLDETKGVMFGLAAALLVIGGVGVLNMMWDSVHERRQEIGVRLAIGARRGSVVAQFFFETFLVTSLGGLLGAALGVAGCLFLASLSLPDLVPVPVLEPGVVVLALGVMLVVGLAAALIPAWRAARVDPAATLRME